MYARSTYMILPLVYYHSSSCAAWLFLFCAMTHSYVFIRNVCKIHTYDEFAYVLWRILLYTMTHSHLCHDSFLCVPWLILSVEWQCMRDPHTWHDTFLCVPWLILLCAMTYSLCVPWLIPMCWFTMYAKSTHTHTQPNNRAILQHTAIHTLQHTATHCNIRQIHTHALEAIHQGNDSDSATQCNTHTATHCNTLQDTATQYAMTAFLWMDTLRNLALTSIQILQIHMCCSALQCVAVCCRVSRQTPSQLDQLYSTHVTNPPNPSQHYWWWLRVTCHSIRLE